jgi:hypothetical protein
MVDAEKNPDLSLGVLVYPDLVGHATNVNLEYSPRLTNDVSFAELQ